MAVVLGTLAGGVGHAGQVTVSNTQGLAFGVIVAGSTYSGTVTVSAAGLRSCGGAVTCIGQLSAPAAYSVGGDPSVSYTIALPVEATVTNPAGNSMIVDNFQDSEGGSGTLGSTGEASFTVGARLNINPGQPAENYSGTFDVIVEYQ